MFFLLTVLQIRFAKVLCNLCKIAAIGVEFPPATFLVGPVAWKEHRILLLRTKHHPSNPAQKLPKEWGARAAVLWGCDGRGSPAAAQGQLWESKTMEQ